MLLLFPIIPSDDLLCRFTDFSCELLLFISYILLYQSGRIPTFDIILVLLILSTQERRRSSHVHSSLEAK